MAQDLDGEKFTKDWTCALAVRLINLGWFRVGSDRYAKEHRTFGITTLNKTHVVVRGSRVTFRYRGKHRIWVHTAVVDAELAEAVRSLTDLKGRRLFRYQLEDGSLYNLNDRKLNDYIQSVMGDEFTAKDFRTWGGTLTAALAFAERGIPNGNRGQARRRPCDADGRRTTGQHTRRRSIVVCQPGRRRAVPRRSNDPRFSPTSITRCRCA
ncbi:MAG: hypothetical protein H0V79_07230 [Actinobacteria bacterium]|nr:hypothetical protein [Actinomycetota bacterium]